MYTATMSYKDMLLSAHVAGALAAVLVFVGRRFGLASSFQSFQTYNWSAPRHVQKCCTHELRNMAECSGTVN